MFARLWDFFVDVRAAFWFLLATSLLLMIGSFYVDRYPHIYRPLNTLLFQDWYRAYGMSNPFNLWWLFILVAVLIALGVNTAVCTLARLKSLWFSRKQTGLKKLGFKITPSIIHVCFLVMLSGHFLSMVAGYSSVNAVVPGAKISVPGEMTFEIFDKQCDYYSSPATMRGLISQCTVTLKSEKAGTHDYMKVSIIEPAFADGYSFHLGMDKKSEIPRLKLTVKRDHGLRLILTGFFILTVLMLWYFPQIKKRNKRG